MLFLFKRDEEGREHIYVGDVCVATISMLPFYGRTFTLSGSVPGITQAHINDAIELADEAGFWTQEAAEWNVLRRAFKDGGWKNNEVTVDVHVADSTVLPVTTGEGES